MFLHHDWSPTVVNPIVWTCFGKAHIGLYKVSQKTRPMGLRDLFGGTDLVKLTKEVLLN